MNQVCLRRQRAEVCSVLVHKACSVTRVLGKGKYVVQTPQMSRLHTNKEPRVSYIMYLVPRNETEPGLKKKAVILTVVLQNLYRSLQKIFMS